MPRPKLKLIKGNSTESGPPGRRHVVETYDVASAYAHLLLHTHRYRGLPSIHALALLLAEESMQLPYDEFLARMDAVLGNSNTDLKVRVSHIRGVVNRSISGILSVQGSGGDIQSIAVQRTALNQNRLLRPDEMRRWIYHFAAARVDRAIQAKIRHAVGFLATVYDLNDFEKEMFKKVLSDWRTGTNPPLFQKKQREILEDLHRKTQGKFLTEKDRTFHATANILNTTGRMIHFRDGAHVFFQPAEDTVPEPFRSRFQLNEL